MPVTPSLPTPVGLVPTPDKENVAVLIPAFQIPPIPAEVVDNPLILITSPSAHPCGLLE